MKTVDLYDLVDPGATNIPFGTITLRGDQVGSTGIIVTIKTITADGGDSFTPGVVPGNFIIDSGRTQPIISDHTSTHLSQIPSILLSTRPGETCILPMVIPPTAARSLPE